MKNKTNNRRLNYCDDVHARCRLTRSRLYLFTVTVFLWLHITVALGLNLPLTSALDRPITPESVANNTDRRIGNAKIKPVDVFTRADVELSESERSFEITEHHLGKELVCGGIWNGKEIRSIIIKRFIELIQLRNCTVIEGSLKISNFGDDISLVSFPKLVEITDYLLFYRVRGLPTLSTLFPNLAVIRGQKLFFDKYALVIHSCFNLRNLGLKSLTAIRQGALRIEKNPMLCYLNTIDWNKLQDGIESKSKFGDNQDADICKSKLCHSGCSNGCWSPDLNACQRVCPNQCFKSKRYCDLSINRSSGANCCDQECLGGCIVKSHGEIANWQSAVCVACKNFHYGGSCRRKCPADTFEFENRRCVSREQCVKMTLRSFKFQRRKNETVIIKKKEGKFRFKPHDGKCLAHCPAGFTVNATDPHTCVKCQGVCQKTCTGSFPITKSEDLSKLRGCTKVIGVLEIKIRNVDQSTALFDSLEENLGMIEEIQGRLRVYRTDSIYSLDFLKSLTLITASRADEKALEVMYNPYLRSVFDLESRRKRNKLVKIGIGRPVFHFNNRLCYQSILEFLQLADYPLDVINEYDVNPENNGNEVSCKIHKLDAKVDFYSPKGTGILVKFDDFYHSENLADKRSLLRYDAFYKKTSSKNVSIFDGKDACSKDSWESTDIKPRETKHPVYSLEPWTQYALYVEAVTIKSKHDQGAISDVIYFRTTPTTPDSPDIYETSSDVEPDESMADESLHALSVKWTSPRKPNGNVTHYVISWRKLPHEVQLSSTDSCNSEAQSHLEEDRTGAIKLDNHASSTTVPATSSVDTHCACQEFCESLKDSEKSRTTKELERLEEIAFHDALMNDAFQKNPFFTRRARKRRYARPEIEATSTDTQTTRKLESTPSSDVEPILTVNVSASVLAYTILNLTHYAQYRVEVRACHDDLAYDPENNWPELTYQRCSKPTTAFGWTPRVRKLDNIVDDTIEVEISNKSEVSIKWLDPPEVNGAITRYHLKFNDVTKREHMPICISYRDFQKASGYQFRDLPPGNYSLQIRATSLAGTGEWTEPKFFIIEDTQKDLSYLSVLFIAVICCLFVLCCIVLPLFVYKKFNRDAQLPDRVYSSVNPEYVGNPFEADEWELPRRALEICEEIGAGHYGCVFRGVVKGLTGKASTMPCAIKTTKPDATFHDRMEFLNEAQVMKKYKSFHIIELYGIISQTQPVCIVMELMEFGDLKTFLRRHREDLDEPLTPLTDGDFLNMACDIADGMAYLTSKRHVHRDLAARNCMVDSNLVVKVADFGLSREIYEDDYYRNARRGFLPIRWMAPESLLDGVFTHESDIWSFGVVLWEMATLAAQPYSGLSNEEVNVGVQRGAARLQAPESTHPKLRLLMDRCFEDRAKNRPSFLQIIEILKNDVRPEFRHNSFFHSKMGQIAKSVSGMDEASCDDWDVISNEPTLISELAETIDGSSIRMWEDLPLDTPFTETFEAVVARDSPDRMIPDHDLSTATTNDIRADTSRMMERRHEPLPDLFANDDIPLQLQDSDVDGSEQGSSTPSKTGDRAPVSAQLTPSSSFYVLPDAPRGNDRVDYDRPNGHHGRYNDYVDEPIGGPDSGIHRSYSPSSFLHQSEEEKPRRLHHHHHHPQHHQHSPERSASVSSQIKPPHLGLRDRREFARGRGRQRDESHSSGMSTMTTNSSSKNVSIQEDEDGYVVRSFSAEGPEDSDSATTAMAEHFLTRVVA